MPTRLFRALVFCAVLSLSLTHAYGGSKTWTGATDSNWSTSSNWSPAVLPGLTDDVVIYHPTGDTVNLNPGNVVINSLTLGGSGLPSASLLTGFGQGVQHLTIRNLLKIGQSGDLELYAGNTVTLSDLGGEGIFQNNGRLYVAPGAVMDIPDGITDTVVAGSSYFIEGTLTQNYFSHLDTIEGATSSLAAAEVHLDNGKNWVMAGFSNAKFTDSGYLEISNGTGLTIYTNVVINQGGNLWTAPTVGRGNYLTIFGDLTNNGTFFVGFGDTAEILGNLTNNSLVTVGIGGTLTLDTQPGIPDIPANSRYQIFGTFNQMYDTSTPSAFYDLTTIEGDLNLANGQTTDITPGGGTTLNNSGSLLVQAGSTLNIHGTLNNSTPLSELRLFGSNGGAAANLDKLNNNGQVVIDTGATLNLLQQSNGITDVVAGSEFDLGGTFNAGTNNGFYKLDYVHGTLRLDGPSVNITSTPSLSSGNVEVWGLLKTSNGATFSVNGGLAVMKGAGLIVGDPLATTVNISGTLTNLGGSIEVIGPDAVLNAGSIVNGGILSLPGGSTVNAANGFYQLDAGTLGESIGAGDFGILVAADGEMMLAGTLDIMLDPDFNPTIGSTYQFLLFQPGELSGVFANIQHRYFNGGTEQWIVIYDNADGYVELQAAPSPEPASFLLLGSGLLSAAVGMRRKMK